MSQSSESVSTAAQPLGHKLSRALYRLQVDQLHHDEGYHKDIVRLTMHNRLKHMALHMAKYAGTFCDKINNEDADIQRTLVDSFIISLASANILNIDLSKHSTAEEFSPTKDTNSNNSPVGFVLAYTSEVGRLAKACESLDHIEAYPYREKMTQSVVNLVKLIASESVRYDIDLVECVPARLLGVKKKSIFHESTGELSGAVS